MPSDEEKKLWIDTIKTEVVLSFKAMQPEIEAGVEKKIETVVNGKINALRAVVDTHVKGTLEHREKVDEFIKLMSPGADAIKLFTLLRSFAVWLGGFGILAALVWAGIKAYFNAV